MVLFGLTGGIACGKTLVAGVFRQRGLAVIDADEVARELVQPGTKVWDTIVEQFGSDVIASVIDERGRLDRKAFGAMVFSDPSKRRLLNQITHPAIEEQTRYRASQLSMQGHELAAYEAALLVETGVYVKYRPLVVVVVDERLQLQRLVQRDGCTHKQAVKRIGAQMAQRDKAAVADYVINTGGDVQQVRADALHVLRQICSKYGVCSKRYGL